MLLTLQLRAPASCGGTGGNGETSVVGVAVACVAWPVGGGMAIHSGLHGGVGYERGYVRNDELQFYRKESASCSNGISSSRLATRAAFVA